MAASPALDDFGWFEISAALADDAFGDEIRACLDAIADELAVHEAESHGGRPCDCRAPAVA